MSVSDVQLFAYGQQLAQAKTEVELRTSVCRSYYAAYHRAKSWHEALPSHGFAKSGAGVHATLIQCLTNPSVVGPAMLKSKSIGYMLQSMKIARQQADYDLASTVDCAQAETVSESARILIEKAV